MGTYQSEEGASECVKCAVGSVTVYEGSEKLWDCTCAAASAGFSSEDGLMYAVSFLSAGGALNDGLVY